MPCISYVFNETSPSAAGTAFSNQKVTGGVANYLPVGIAGPLDDYEALDITAELVGATGGTLDVYVQTNAQQDNGNWFDIVHFPQLLAGAGAIIYDASISLFTNATAPIVVGKNASPALTNSPSIVQGPFGDRIRLVMVAGVSTSAGAAVKVTVLAQRTRIREVWSS